MANARYRMRAYDSGKGGFTYWNAEGRPDRGALFAPAPVGAYSRIRVVEVLPLSTTYDTVLYHWEGSNTSALTQVRGNGIDGIGAGGDWTLSGGTWPNDDAEALQITNATGVGGASPGADAIWLFNDYEGPLPSRFALSFRKSFISDPAPLDIGVIVYYLDTDHYFLLVPGAITEFFLGGRNGASGYAGVSIGEVYDASASRDTVHGSMYAATCWHQLASQTRLPSITAKFGGPFLPSYSGTGGIGKRISVGGLTASAGDATWQDLANYAPRIGIWAKGLGIAGSEYISSLTFYGVEGGV